MPLISKKQLFEAVVFRPREMACIIIYFVIVCYHITLFVPDT